MRNELMFVVLTCLVVSVEGAFTFRAPVESPAERVPGCLWVEAESFSDYGDWRLDTQFTHKMGSAYLIAPGVGNPIGAAKTRISIERAGTYRAWVRTKDWLPEFSPGKFRLDVGGRKGAVLGASGKNGWCWEKAGDFDLQSGPVELSLVDLSGAFARCDAILLTRDLTRVPPDDGQPLLAERLQQTGGSPDPADCGSFDVIVVGSGTAGMGAVLASARGGAKTALVHDRPVMGGNSSLELGIGTDGAAGAHPNCNYFARETGLVEELNLTKKYVRDGSRSEAYAFLCSREPNVSVFGNKRVTSVEKAGSRIVAVLARDTLTGRICRYRAKVFIDCTGDGWVGRFAGAELMHGREARSEFSEEQAPEKRDALVMSGCLMDGYLSYRFRTTDHPVSYATPRWADVLPEGFVRDIGSVAPAWWIEHHGRFDELEDPERARDELVRIVFAYWGWVKNVWKGPGSANAELVSVPFMNGRREGYRLVGDYVLTANDCLAGRLFDDRISYGGWPLDTHDPLGIENPVGNGYWKHHPAVPIYTIPYRCLYSRNIPNLMMAGRNVSVTHIALGSVRVESTLFCLGQAAGTAASMAVARGLTPREVGRDGIRELQQRLLKDDMYIPGLKNEDPLDLARQATRITASSSAKQHVLAKDSSEFPYRHAGFHALDQCCASGFRRGSLDRLEGVFLDLTNENEQPTEVVVDVCSSEERGNGPVLADRVATARAMVSPGRQRFVELKFVAPVVLTRPYLWIVCRPAKGLSWHRRLAPPVFGGVRVRGREGNWTMSTNDGYYSLRTVPDLTAAFDTRPEYVTDGVARPVGGCSHGWVSDPASPLPQSVLLHFDSPVTANQIRLTFDTDLTPRYPAAWPKTLVRDYHVDLLRADGRWERVVEESDNGYRLRVHDFPETCMTELKVTVTATHGDASARVQEIRLYRRDE